MQSSKSTQGEVVKLKAPNKWNVILLNDNQTTMEFVISVLTTIFNRTSEDAEAITILIHENGKAIAGTYSFEVAEQKASETITKARQNSFPLQTKIEECE